jgi:uncharacterized membrane protein
MKAVWSGLAVVGFLVLAGCNRSTTAGGGDAGGSFTLDQEGPLRLAPTVLRQGESKAVAITLHRRGNFKEDVDLKVTVDGSGTGLKTEITPPSIKGTESRPIEVQVTAAGNATPGSYKVVVTGTPRQGSPVSMALEVKVGNK